jgi:fatty acid-binding protein DegV
LTFDIDGRLAFFGAARGRKKSLKQLMHIFEERVDVHSQNTVIIGAADSGKEQKMLAEQVLKRPKEIAMWQTSIGPVIGSHVGPGMIAVIFWGADRRENMLISDRIAKAVSGFKREAKTEQAGE